MKLRLFFSRIVWTLTLLAIIGPLVEAGARASSRTDAGDSSLAAAVTDAGDALKLKTVVIDPGHGGKDPGCVSADRKTYEKNVVLAVSKLFAEKIRKAYPDVNVILTRETDVFVELDKRAKIATKANANLFISVHVNAAEDPRTRKINTKANGYSAWILGQSSKYDAYGINYSVVRRENSVIYLEDDYSTKYQALNSDSPEAKIFMQLMINAYREQSVSFAEKTCQTMKGHSFSSDLGVRQENIAVLRLATMPAVLVELGFITNPTDLAYLRSKGSYEAMAENLFRAFAEYKEEYDHSMEFGGEEEAPEPEVKPVAPKVEPEEKPEPVHSPDSVAAPKAEPVVEQKASDEPAPKTEAAAEAGEVYYGVQVLATSTLMFKTDPYFLGQEVKIEKSGSLYKYIIGVSDTPEDAKRAKEQIVEKYPGAFAVSVKNHEITRL